MEFQGSFLSTVMRLAVIVLSLTTTLGTSAGSLTRSEEDEGIFQSDEVPERLVFFPDNQGAAIFTLQNKAASTALLSHEETLCNAVIIVVDDPSYDFHPAEIWQSNPDSDGYYTRLDLAVSTAATNGFACEFRIPDSFFQSKLAVEHFKDWLTSSITSGKMDIPLVTVSKDAESVAATAFVQKLHDAMPQMPVGRILDVRWLPGLTDGSAASFATDYFIASQELTPERFKGQGEIAYWKSVVGTVPVLIGKQRPDFIADLCTFTAGAAGLQYHGFPASASTQRKSAWRNLRALTSFISHFHGQLMPANQYFSYPMDGAFMTRSHDLALMLPPGFRGTVLLPPSQPHTPDGVSLWYQPLTDESIILPQERMNSQLLKVESPGPGRWVFSRHPQPALDNNGTSITAILEEVRY